MCYIHYSTLHTLQRIIVQREETPRSAVESSALPLLRSLLPASRSSALLLLCSSAPRSSAPPLSAALLPAPRSSAPLLLRCSAALLLGPPLAAALLLCSSALCCSAALLLGPLLGTCRRASYPCSWSCPCQCNGCRSMISHAGQCNGSHSMISHAGWRLTPAVAIRGAVLAHAKNLGFPRPIY